MRLEPFTPACLRVCRAGILVSCLVSGLAWLIRTDAHPRGRSTLATNGSLPSTKANQPAQARLVETYGKLPLSFEANRGQTDHKVRFLARGRDYALFLTATEAVLSFKKRAEPGGDDELSPETHAPRRETGDSGGGGTPSVLVDMKLVGANPTPEVSGLELLPSTANYFIGNDPKKWRTNVPTYAKVRYKEVYPGIDLIYYGNQGQLEYDFVVEPGADPRAIRLSLQGGGPLKLDAQGDLVLGEVRFRKPRLYQEIRGRRQDISGRYVLKGARQVAFQVASYDVSQPLMIDPVLSYSTFLGGSNFDQINGIAVDSSGNAYVAGFTSSNPFPTTSGAFDATYGGSSDVFVSKFNPSVSGSSSLVYSTYIGGSFGEQALAIAVDSSGVAYVAGQALSSNFPTTAGALDTTYNGNGDAFLLKLGAAGSSLLYSTYLGGSGLDQALGVALDSSGNIYIAGQTFSTNFPTLNALQIANGGIQDAFVAEFTNSGSLLYSTYLGGSGYDQANAIAVDSLGRAYVTGYTTSSDFPVHNAPAVGAACSSCANNTNDAFVAAIGASGSGFVYSTYLGGGGDDQGMGIAVDAVGNAYVTGSTFSTDFPTTVGAYQRSLLGQSSAFVTMVNANGSTLGYSTYLGSDGNTYGQAIAVAGGSAYVGGSTNGSGFPLVGAIQSGKAGGVDAFATEINPTGSAIFFSTYFGGSAYDQVTAVALNSGNMYIAGSTHSTDLPTAQAYQGSYGGGDSDAFLAKIQISTVGLSPGSVTFSTQQVGTTSPPQPVTLTNNGSSSLSIASITFTGSNNGDFAQTNNCGSSVARGASCAINVTFSPTAGGTRSATLTVNDNAFGSPHTVSVTGTGTSSTGGSPAASLSLTALAFGNQSLGSTSLAQTVTLSNSGTASLSITSIGISGTNAGDYGQSNNCGNSVAAGANCAINVTFSPTVIGARSASLTVTDDDSGSPQTASLTGSGATSSGSAPTLVQVQNNIITTTTAQTSWSVNITTTAGDLLVAFCRESSNGTDNFTVTDSAGQTWTQTSSGYKNESSTGPRSGMFYVANSAAVTSVTVNYTTPGGVLKPGIMVYEISNAASSGVADGSVNNGTATSTTTSTSASLTTSNSNDMLIFGTDTSGDETGWTAGAGYTIPNNSVRTGSSGSNVRMAMQYQVVASPQTNASAAMTYANSNWNGNIFAAFKGGTSTTGPPASLTPSSLTFANQTVSSTSAAQAVALQNGTSSPLSISSIAFTGTNSGDFAQTNNCGASLAAGASCSIDVTFTPTAVGTRSATLTVTDNASNSPQTASVTGTGAGLPGLSPSPVPSFGNQNVGVTSAAQAVTLSNPTTTALSVTSITFTGANPGDFGQTNNCGSSVAAGANCTINVTFTPTATGSRSATLTVTDSASNSPQTSGVSGTGTALPSLSPSPVPDFGGQNVGTTSAAQAVTLSNPSGAALTITSVGFTGTNPGDFGQTNNCPLSPSTLAANATCTINVTFTPTATGTRSAILTVTDNASNSPQTSGVSGTGTMLPSLSPSPVPSFGNQNVGITSAAQAVTLSNPTTTALSITSITFTGANPGDFGQTNNCGSSVAAGGNCTINVTFTPTATGSRSATLTVTDNASNSPQTAGVSGTGVGPTASLSPTSLSFGKQNVNTTSAPKTVTLSNTGNAPLTINSITLTGANANNFALTSASTCPLSGGTVPAPGNCTIVVTFTPTGKGGKTAAVSVADNASGSPQQVSLSGTGH